MNRYFPLTFSLIILLTLICCSGNTSKPDPDNTLINKETIAPNLSQDLPVAQFYEMKESMKDVQKQIARLQTRVMEYENKSFETNYTERLKELIDERQPAHKIFLKNGSIIEGTIEKDKLDYLLVDTDVGKLTINKSDIESIDDLILPTPDVIFIGHGKEEVFKTYRLFTGKVMNQGSRRGDFVRVIYSLWGENTQLIRSDSSFVDGSQVIYRSGIVTDTVLEPNRSAQFKVQISIPDSIIVTYITRDIRWALFD